MDLRNQKGQTVVEYILLMAVSVSLIITFINSDIYKRIFGSGGSLGTMIKEQNQFAYRHAYVKRDTPDIPRENPEGRDHPSYYNQTSGETRFFGPKLAYPQ